MPTQTNNIDIPITNGKGTATITKWTAGKTLSGKLTITTDLQRIDTLPNDPPETWTITLNVNNKPIIQQDNVKNGQTLNAEGITTPLFGNTTFTLDLNYTIPHDFTAKITLEITY